ncbi:pseudouridine synthase [Xylona heveae TC161]|uniref:tRNA pseudouridine(55) synthase n=1 Tax=Xylona heveae (strain CBS 132557 / TC161) TaxID=1328760 RepID=A0A165JT01_XYLHT|nr:pseudouridine synthase [Xylona heveae TC161]KZF26583.1 pseudouridine synthase [Xylona heveae TC161]
MFKAAGRFQKAIMTDSKIVEGVFAINKPPSISSAQVLRDLQTHFNPSKLFAPWLSAERKRLESEYARQGRRKRGKAKHLNVKMGHGGTLDPMATGVLITGVGKGTKELQKFLECTKVYETVVLFGVATDTYDRLGKVLRQAPFEHVTREKVEEALKQFRGNIMQRPPIFSALHIDGKRLYEYAREGKPLPREIEKRPVSVPELEIVEWYEPGTHQYQWPTEQAEKESKDAAEQVLHLSEVAPVEPAAVPNSDQSLPEPSAPAAASDDAGSKRKRSPEAQAESDADATTANPEPLLKRQKASAEGGTMSGALPTASETGETSAQAETAPPQTATRPPAVKLRMTVTSGFYVRSLCHDLGEAVGSLAIMSELIRSRQGGFTVGQNVLEYDDLAKGEDVWGPQVERMLDEWNDKDKNGDGEKSKESQTQAPKSRENQTQGQTQAESPKSPKSMQNKSQSPPVPSNAAEKTEQSDAVA